MAQIDFFTLDSFIVVVVLISMLIGFVKGATKEILSLLSWAGGILLTILMFSYVKDIARQYISHALIADIVTACSLFVIFLTILSIFNYICSNFIKRSVLSGVDKFIGALFGAARGVILLSIMNVVANQWFLVDAVPEWISKSTLKPYVVDVGNFIILILPKSFQEQLVSNMNQLNKQSIMNFLTHEVIGDGKREEIARAEAVPQKRYEYNDTTEETADADKEARNLATLKPKEAVDSPEDNIQITGKTAKEKLDMKRFLDQREMIEPDDVSDSSPVTKGPQQATTPPQQSSEEVPSALKEELDQALPKAEQEKEDVSKLEDTRQ